MRLRRGPSEAGASATIGVGVAMLLQPFSMQVFTYSFAVILAGTIAFVVVSHFPD